MKKTNGLTATKMKISLLLIVSILLTSCGPARTFFAARNYDKVEVDGLKNNKSIPSLGKDLFLINLAREFGLMAHFANVVYRKDLESECEAVDKKNSGDGRDACACQYLTNDVIDDYGMPNVGDASLRWYRWKHKNACFSDLKSGLYYETYIYADSNQPDNIEFAVIAFRGTENRPGQMFIDWRSNLSAVFGFAPPQYKKAAELVPPIIKELTSKNSEIYVVGHSLGGGLAQQTGYMSKEVKESFLFNTSPVTNWTWLAEKALIANQYPTFRRFSHAGEALSGIRSLATAFTKPRFHRHDIGVQLYENKNPIKGHSMKIISCGLANILQRNPSAGNDNSESNLVNFMQYYPLAYIDNLVIEESNYDLCDKKTLNAFRNLTGSDL
jgi:hypothetical protein